jgi:hypothetical protein
MDIKISLLVLLISVLGLLDHVAAPPRPKSNPKGRAS